MSKERMVTRTIKVTTFEVAIANMENMSIRKDYVAIPSAETMNDKKLKEAIESYFTLDENEVIVKSTKHEVVEKLFAMTEGEFIKNSIELPLR